MEKKDSTQYQINTSNRNYNKTYHIYKHSFVCFVLLDASLKDHPYIYTILYLSLLPPFQVTENPIKY